MTRDPPFSDPAVASAFAAFPPDARRGLMLLRRMIFSTAADMPEIGPVDECLKWGQPAYLTPSGAGSTIRLGVPKEGGFALYVHCRTQLLPDFRAAFPDDFDYDGNRAVRFADGDMPKAEPLRFLLRDALSYHLR